LGKSVRCFVTKTPNTNPTETAQTVETYQPRPDLLSGRIILVTGVADSLGYAVAAACAERGATVILSDRDQGTLEPLYDRIDGAGNPQPAILPLDLDKPQEKTFFAAADSIGEMFGRLDGLVHCAAFAPFLSRIDDYDLQDWERVLRINLTAPFLLTQATLPLLREAADASVVFTSDRVGRRGLAYWGAFGAAKFGIEGLMQILAEETQGSGNIRVNSIDPGILRTGLRTRLYPAEDPQGVPPPETATARYLYLLGPDSRGVTGRAFDPDPPG
jgi:NAD(P)-dependent dehydrogenase (short-subunit alcohol dehydrogenase family)